MTDTEARVGEATTEPRVQVDHLDGVDVSIAVETPDGKRYRVGAVRLGDTIVFQATGHIVTSLARRNGFGEPVADCADGWSISLCPDGHLEIPEPTDWCCVLASGGDT